MLGRVVRLPALLLLVLVPVAAAACGTPRARRSGVGDGGGGGGGDALAAVAVAPEEAVAPGAAVAAALGGAATPPARCVGPLVAAAPYPEAFVDEAAAGAAAALRFAAVAMRGPSPTRADAAPDCHDVDVAAASPPFRQVAVCATGDRRRPLGPDNIAAYRLVVATAAGWWTTDLVREHWPHGDPGDEPRVARVRDLVVADRLGDAGAEVSLVAEVGPPGGARRMHLVLCSVGASGRPGCLDQRFAAGGPFHGPGALSYRLTVGCDGVLDVAGWEGGAQVRLVHGRGPIDWP